MIRPYDVTWHGERVFTLATQANVDAMHKAAFTVEKDVKQNMTLKGTGRTVQGVWKPGVGYKRTKDGKIHYAAPPGKPPAIDLGVLRASMMSDVRITGLSVEGRIGPDIDYIEGHSMAGSDVEYGLYLELGTKNMQPRPYLRPALRRTQKDVKKIFRDANK
ncbi:MAG: HK97-gp10 family putative phage morphogenesis protein [Planctomycetota bacterium]|jgi:HK97 gp10 family phage protein